MGHVTAAFNQRSYRFRNDDGSQTAATWKATQNTAVTQATDVAFRLRIETQETAGGAANNQTIVLQYNLNGAGFINVGATTPVQLSASAFVADQTATTNQLTGGTGGFVPGTVQTAVNGSNTSFVGNDHTEHEWCILLDSAQLTNGDTITFQNTINGANPNTTAATPTLTADVPIPPQVRAVGTASETEAAHGTTAVPGVTTIPVGTASEVEAANPAIAGASAPVGVASETEAAQPIGVATTVTIPVGTASEVEEAGSVAVPTVVPVGTATETETAQPATPSASTAVAVGTASEVEAVQPVGEVLGTTTLAVGTAAETETAQSVAAVVGAGPQVVAVGTATETEAAHGTTAVGARNVPVGTAAEVEVAQSVPVDAGAQPQTISVGTASEVEAAPSTEAVAGEVSVPVGTAAESEAAGTITLTAGAVTITVGTVSEVELARAVGASADLGQVISVGTAYEGGSGGGGGGTGLLVRLGGGLHLDEGRIRPSV